MSKEESQSLWTYNSYSFPDRRKRLPAEARKNARKRKPKPPSQNLWHYNSYEFPASSSAARNARVENAKHRGTNPSASELWTYNSYEFPAPTSSSQKTSSGPRSQSHNPLAPEAAGSASKSVPTKPALDIFDDILLEHANNDDEISENKAAQILAEDVGEDAVPPAGSYNLTSWQPVLLTLLVFGLGITLFWAIYGFTKSDDLSGFNVCNAVTNPTLSNCPSAAGSGGAINLLYGIPGNDEIAFVKRLQSGTGTSVTKSGAGRVDIVANVISLTPRLVVGSDNLAPNSITLSLNYTETRACNAGNNTGQNLTYCPPGSFDSGVPIFFANASAPNVTLARRLVSLSPALILDYGGPFNELITIDLNVANLSESRILCNAGDNTGLELPRCPSTGNNTGVPLLYGNSSEPIVANVRRIATQTPEISITSAAPDSDIVYIGFNEPDPCNLTCQENYLVEISNTNSGFGISQGFNQTLSGLSDGAAILSGESIVIENSPYSVAAGGDLHDIRDGSHNGLLSGSGNSMQNCSFSFMGGGVGNIMENCAYSAIMHGSGNIMTNSDYCVIINGEGHLITDVSYASIIAGTGHTIAAGADRASILCGDGITISGVLDADTAHAANLLATDGLRIGGLRTIPGGSTVAAALGDFMFLIESGAGTATVELPANIPDGLMITTRIIGNIDLDIVATDGASLCPVNATCTVNGTESVVEDNAARNYIFSSSGNFWYGIS